MLSQNNIENQNEEIDVLTQGWLETLRTIEFQLQFITVCYITELGISILFWSKHILFKKRLVWTGKKLEALPPSLPPNEKPVSNKSCLLHGPIPPFRLSYFWASIISFSGGFTDWWKDYFWHYALQSSSLFTLNGLRQGSYFINFNSRQTYHSYLYLKLTF